MERLEGREGEVVQPGKWLGLRVDPDADLLGLWASPEEEVSEIMTKTKAAWGVKTKRGALVAQAFSCRSEAEQLCFPEFGDKVVRVEIREIRKSSGSSKA